MGSSVTRTRKRFVACLAGTALEGPARRAYSAAWERIPDAVLSAASVKGRNYDRMTLRIAAGALAGGGSAVDVGACQGDILKVLVRHSDAPHWAFEPIPAFAARLQRRFPDVTVAQCAVSDTCGEAEFRYLPGAPGYSSLHVRAGTEDGLQVRPLRVSTCRLDDCIPAGAQVAFVKIDVEGAEAAVLRGARELLRRCQPVIVFECAPAALPDCIDALEGTGLAVSLMADFLAGAARSTAEVLRMGRERHEFYYVAAPDPNPSAP